MDLCLISLYNLIGLDGLMRCGEILRKQITGARFTRLGVRPIIDCARMMYVEIYSWDSIYTYGISVSLFFAL